MGKTRCKYFDTPCELGYLAPECDMTCELNIEAKSYMQEKNRIRNYDCDMTKHTKQINGAGKTGE